MSKDMKDIFEKLPMGDKAPQGLRNWTEFTSRQPRGKSWFDKRFKWAFGGVAAAGLVVAAVMFMTPQQATAKTWDLITNAYDDIITVYIEIDVAEDDEDYNLVFAMKGNRWHASLDGKADISYDGSDLLIWEYGSDTAMLVQVPFALNFPADKVIKQLRFTNIMSHHHDEADVDISAIVVRDGRSVYDVIVRDGSMVAYLTIDAGSDLPLNVTVTEDGVTKAELMFRFNEDVDESLLSPVLPTGIKFEVLNFADLRDGPDGFNFDFFGHDQDDDHEVTPPRTPTAA
ncbi:MAG: hypothetical protein IH944_07675 [Armatimonadetes bacterium]|nr:hypothetical protein [Armatimonadota bacterium]